MGMSFLFQTMGSTLLAWVEQLKEDGDAGQVSEWEGFPEIPAG